jgi:hypothetical protein
MMAVLEAILPAVARSSSLSLELYQIAASCQNDAAKDLITAANAINNFASIVKQIGTLVKEDDCLPSNEVCPARSFYAEYPQRPSTYQIHCTFWDALLFGLYLLFMVGDPLQFVESC